MTMLRAAARTIPPVRWLAEATASGRGYSRIVQARPTPGLTVDPAAFRIGEIEINNNCNLDCLMCRPSISRRERSTMDLDLFARCVEYQKRFGRGPTAVHTIGEPLLNPRLEDYLLVLLQHDVKIMLSSNGLLLARRMDLLFEYADVISSLRLSIDGATRETYEKIRRPGRFDQLLSNLDAFADANKTSGAIKKVSIHSIVSNDVRHELAYHLQFYSRYADMRNIHLTLVSGLCPDNSYFLEESVLKNHIVPWRPCDQLFEPTLHVLTDGRVSACCRDYHGELVFGGIGDGSPVELINNETITALRRQHIEDSIPEGTMCSNCFRVDPRVSELFEFFVSRLVSKYYLRWDVERMQARFDEFFACFEKEIPAKKRFLQLVA